MNELTRKQAGRRKTGAARQPSIIQQIGRVIGLLRDEGKMAIVLVEQYFDFAFDPGDSFTVLKRGEIVLEGSKHSLSREPLLQAASV